MLRSDKEFLYGLEQFLVQMHQVQGEPDFTLCPTRFDRDFEREFSAGDEQQESPLRTDQVQFDHGHVDGDFA